MNNHPRTIDVGTVFYHRLANRDENQGDGEYTAIEFRNEYLSDLDDAKMWKNDDVHIYLDFKNVKRIGPSFANEAFAYFVKYAKPNRVRSKIKIINASDVQRRTIDLELEDARG